MTSIDNEDFLAQCEEEFKNRFTEKDEEFMKVFNSESSTPPILKNTRIYNDYRVNDHRHNRQYEPYNRDRYNRYQDRGRRDNYNREYQGGGSRHDNRREYQDSTSRSYQRGYNDYDQDDRGHGNRYGQRHN